jgi:hypothetical protein
MRNDLVHPKVEELRNGRAPKAVTAPYERAKAAVADAEIFFARFVAIDTEAELLMASV